MTVLLALVTGVLLASTAAGVSRDLGSFEFSYDGADGLRLKSATSWRNVRGVPKAFSAQLGEGLSPQMLVGMRAEAKGSGTVLHLGRSTTLEVQPTSAACSSITWTSQELPEIRDCVDFGTAQWFGAFEQKDQKWPIQKLVKENYAFVTKEINNMGVAERFWLNSEGLYIYVEPFVPLFYNSNATGDERFCFVAKFEEPFKAVPELRLHYQVCSLPTAQEAHLHALNSVLNARPTGLPDERMVRDPIWSTWARYKRQINESVVLTFAQEILDHGFNNSQLEIDDDWETCYGELTFDTNKFPDPARLSRRLKELDFRVTLWIHPFMNERCPSFNTYKQLGYFASDGNGNTRTSWWNGVNAAIVDFTNPAALTWFVERIRALQISSEVDSFKFDAGETSWMPTPRILTGDLGLQPNLYTSEYVRALVEFAPLAEFRVGMRTQDVPIFVRMVDKDSHWDMDNGLKSVVTTLLAMSTAGYPYVLPDMIGGNSYGLDTVTPELFVRWLQASTFMPSLQFSYVPWSFNDPEVEEICKKFVALHAEWAPLVMQAAQAAVDSGTPINTPVWTVDPDGTDQTAYTIYDEYLLSDRILVAPVLDEGAVSRDIYLPFGVWRDMNSGADIEGRVWLRNYPAPLDVLPWFERQTVGWARSGAGGLQASLVLCGLVLALLVMN